MPSQTALPLLSQQFPFDTGLAYLNHGSLGVAPTCLWDKVNELNRGTDTNPINALDRNLLPGLENARIAVANFVHAQSENLMVIDNTTFGVNMVFHSLALRPGDEILISDQEYGAYERIWQRLACKVVRVKIPIPCENQEEIFSAIMNKVTDNTRVVFLSHITSNLAYRLPVEKVCQTLAHKDIYTVIDGAHCPGQIDLDIESFAPDCYIANCHKWLFAPRSAGFLYASARFQELLKPLVISFGAARSQKTGIPFIDELSWIGTKNWSSLLAIPDAIQFFKEHNFARIREHCRNLAKSCCKEAMQLPGVEILFPDWHTLGLQMVTLKLPISAEHAMETYLTFAQDHNIEVAVKEVQGNVGVRLSVQCYNSNEHITRFLDCLQTVLKKFP